MEALNCGNGKHPSTNILEMGGDKDGIYECVFRGKKMVGETLREVNVGNWN